jgi:methylamine--corrinoid protein Co-methyltransferase
MAEVAHAAAGIPRSQANELALKLLALYKDQLNQRPAGKSFEEVYDLRTLKPVPDWENMYEGVKSEIREMGLPLR